jgi:hypothetical protein
MLYWGYNCTNGAGMTKGSRGSQHIATLNAAKDAKYALNARAVAKCSELPNQNQGLGKLMQTFLTRIYTDTTDSHGLRNYNKIFWLSIRVDPSKSVLIRVFLLTLNFHSMVK